MLSSTVTSHRSAPDFASSAARWPAIDPAYTMSSSTATPRFTGGDPITITSSGIFGVQVHSGRPVRTSSAVTVLGGSVMYITPSTTSGEVSKTPAARSWYTQAGFSCDTFCLLI